MESYQKCTLKEHVTHSTILYCTGAGLQQLLAAASPPHWVAQVFRGIACLQYLWAGASDLPKRGARIVLLVDQMDLSTF